MSFLLVDTKLEDNTKSLMLCPEEEIKNTKLEQEKNVFFDSNKYWSYDFVDNLKEIIENHDITNVSFSNITMSNKFLEDISIIASSKIESISFNNVDLQIELPVFKKIKKVYFNGLIKFDIDLLKFPSLELIEFLSYKTFKGHFLGQNKSLKKMVLWYYNTKFKNLKPITFAPNLNELTIYHTNIESTEGLKSFIDLDLFEVHYGTKLKKLTGINECKKLFNIFFESCKKIENWEIIEKKKFKSLKIVNCGSIAPPAGASVPLVQSLVSKKSKDHG